MTLIQTHQLSFAFGKRLVLEQLDLQVPQGSIFGFLGPNGAGKTTTIRILLGLVRVPPGKVRLFGKDMQQDRLAVLQKTGALIETPSLYRHLSGHDNLEVARRLLGVPRSRIGEVLAIVRLTADAHRKVREYSLGMTQRLGVAQALLPDPELLLLDEPTNGLDPAGIKEVRELMLHLNRHLGKTIFVSSHLLSEIEKTVTHLAIINKGKLLFQDTISSLRQLQAPVLHLQTDNNLVAAGLLRQAHYRVTDQVNGTVQVHLREKAEVARINQLLVEQGQQVYYLNADQQNLEDLFFSLTNQSEAQWPPSRT